MSSISKSKLPVTVSKSIIKPIKDTLRNLMIATAILYVCLLGAGAYVFIENASTTRAICALRSDLELRTQTSKAFLKDHPKGIPGIPAKQITESIENQERTINALDNVSC